MTKTLALLLLSGVLCRDYDVGYRQKRICATEGSSVVMNCAFQYPEGTVKSVMWSHKRHSIYDGPFIYHSDLKQNEQKRFEYIGDTKNNCSLKIHRVRPMDAGEYIFRFITSSDKWTGRGGPRLQVVDLDITLSPNHTLTEGRSVTLTCGDISQRPLSSAVLWFKNGKRVNEGAVLVLNLTLSDSGLYTCSSEGCVGTSGTARIDVEYGPTNTTASMMPAVSRNTTLVCSSHANPPVDAYAWFKTAGGGSLVVGHQSVFSPGDGGRYFCSATNKHGSHNSSTVDIEIKAPRTWFPGSHVREGLIASCVAVLLALITGVVCRRFGTFTQHYYTRAFGTHHDVWTGGVSPQEDFFSVSGF